MSGTRLNVLLTGGTHTPDLERSDRLQRIHFEKHLFVGKRTQRAGFP
jgi:hypothetical protein